MCSRRLVDGGARPLKLTVREQQFVPQRETRKILSPTGSVLGTAEYLDNRLDGVSRIYSDTGVLREESHFSRDELHGSYRTWWASGHRKEQGEYVRGRRSGLYVGTKRMGQCMRPMSAVLLSNLRLERP
jgi:antitoxin component YwqK of YwqJK toxin-antitoxin module